MRNPASGHVYVLELTDGVIAEILPIEEARKDLGAIIDRARFKGEHTVITRTGKPAVVVVPVEWYEKVQAEGTDLARIDAR